MTADESDDRSCYEAVKSFIEDTDGENIDIRRVIVPSEDWASVKEKAKRTEEGLPKTTIDGVTIVWSNKRTKPVAEVNIDV